MAVALRLNERRNRGSFIHGIVLEDSRQGPSDSKTDLHLWGSAGLVAPHIDLRSSSFFEVRKVS